MANILVIRKVLNLIKKIGIHISDKAIGDIVAILMNEFKNMKNNNNNKNNQEGK